jgi:hypothetical protein
VVVLLDAMAASMKGLAKVIQISTVKMDRWYNGSWLVCWVSARLDVCSRLAIGFLFNAPGSCWLDVSCLDGVVSLGHMILMAWSPSLLFIGVVVVAFGSLMYDITRLLLNNLIIKVVCIISMWRLAVLQWLLELVRIMCLIIATSI